MLYKYQYYLLLKSKDCFQVCNRLILINCVNETDDDGDDSRYQLQIADQKGKIMEIPKEEKKVLVIF